VDRPRHQGVPRTGTVQNTLLYCGLSEAEESTVLDQARIVRPQAQTVRSLKKPENPEGDGFVKCIFSVLVDHPGCMTGPSVTALSDIG
jgi:hypothetical protein